MRFYVRRSSKSIAATQQLASFCDAIKVVSKNSRLVSIRKLRMDTALFLYGKRAIFPKVKEINHLRGGVAVYAAQASEKIDAEIG
jgi:hypothetical protein